MSAKGKRVKDGGVTGAHLVALQKVPPVHSPVGLKLHKAVFVAGKINVRPQAGLQT